VYYRLKYPVISDIWQRNWSGIVPFFAFPTEIRKVIYTTNVIESVNRQIRKIIKNKGVFPDDKSIQKIIFLALRNAEKKMDYAPEGLAFSAKSI